MRLSLRKKIFLGHGFELGVTLLVLILAYVNLLKLGRASESILTENYKKIRVAEEMVNSLAQQNNAVLLLLTGLGEDGLTLFDDHKAKFKKKLLQANQYADSVEEREKIDAIDMQFTSLLKEFSTLRDIYREDPAQTTAFYQDKLITRFRSVRELCLDLLEINEKSMFIASERTLRIARKSVLSIGIIGVSAIVVGLFLSLVISTLLVKPLRHIVYATQKIAEGDYDVRVETKSADELGNLAHEFNIMAERLKQYRDLKIGKIMAEKLKNEAIIQNIDDGIIVIDADCKVSAINNAAAETVGLKSADAENRHFLEVIHSEILLKMIKEIIRTGQAPVIEDEKNILTFVKNGVQKHCQFSLTPMRATPDSMLGVILLLRDVTRLKEVDRLKSEFVMIASHELRTPLTTIGMSIDLLKEGAVEKLNSNEKKLLDAAEEEVKRLKQLINDLLDLSKIEAGRIDMEFDRAEVPVILKTVVSILKSQVEEKGIEMTYFVPDRLPAVKVDVNKIAWVLNNLVSNAMRYTPEGGRIHIAAQRRGKHVQVSVKDNGTGIPLEYQSKIFDKFVRVKDSKDEGGTGLGLAICKEIVRAHGGTIWVESIPGKGSKFFFTIPIFPEDNWRTGSER